MLVVWRSWFRCKAPEVRDVLVYWPIAGVSSWKSEIWLGWKPPIRRNRAWGWRWTMGSSNLITNTLLSDFTGLLTFRQNCQAHFHLRIFTFAVPSTWNAILSNGSLISNCWSFTYSGPCSCVTSSVKPSMTYQKLKFQINLPGVTTIPYPPFLNIFFMIFFTIWHKLLDSVGSLSSTKLYSMKSENFVLFS